MCHVQCKDRRKKGWLATAKSSPQSKTPPFLSIHPLAIPAGHISPRAFACNSPGVCYVLVEEVGRDCDELLLSEAMN